MTNPLDDRRRRRRITAGAVLVLLLLVISAAVSYYNLERLAASQDLEERSFQTRWSLQRLLALLADTETGQRGFIITGDESFLEPAQAAFAELPAETERLRNLLGPDIEGQRAFVKLTQLIGAKLRRVQENIRARREGGFEKAERQVASREGKEAMDIIRSAVRKLDKDEQQKLQTLIRSGEAAARRAQMIIIATNVLALITAGVSVRQAWRSERERQAAAAAIEQANANLEEQVAARTGELRHALATLEKEGRQRRRLEAEVLEISERERRRMAEDLHDGQGQILAGALHLVSAHASRLGAARATEAKEAEKLKSIIREALEQTRSIARGLYPVKDVPEGLIVALNDLAERTRRLFQIDCKFAREESIPFPGQAVATNFFWIAQEAVTNAAKHSGARTIEIELGHQSGNVQLTVADNGRGLPVEFQQSNGLGIRIMQYRAEIIGARLEIEARGAGGVRLSCSLPAALWNGTKRTS